MFNKVNHIYYIIFVEELKRVSLVDTFLVSFDVTSLFTSIPLSAIIKLAVDLIKTSQPDLNISEKDLKIFFNFATCETNFLFKGKFFDQIDGILGNHFMGSLWKRMVK